MDQLILQIHKADEVPPVSKMYEKLQVSDRYFGKALTICGEEVNTMVRWDFKHSKWLFSFSGHKELIEYYR